MQTQEEIEQHMARAAEFDDRMEQLSLTDTSSLLIVSLQRCGLTQLMCAQCGGSGTLEQDCAQCGGDGTVDSYGGYVSYSYPTTFEGGGIQMNPVSPAFSGHHSEECLKCSGSGKISVQCSACGGLGWNAELLTRAVQRPWEFDSRPNRL